MSVKHSWDLNFSKTKQYEECEFLVCAEVEYSLENLFEIVKNWSVSGGCDYKCTAPASNLCCCGSAFSFFISASGSGSGPDCNADKPKTENSK